ncbi:hypothetical protein ABBQ38_007565 [Trebouxia sp. C0009 RCD-2024]
MLTPAVSTAASARLFPACTSSRSFGRNRPQTVQYSPNARRFASCKFTFGIFEGSNLSKSRRRTASAPATNVTDIPLIQSEEDLTHALTQNNVIVVDWMAKWCRKCIYLKPKIQKMMEEEFPDLPIVYIDVNAVPGKLVYGNGIKKMPTIALYKNQAKVAEHIAAEGSKDAVSKIRDMIQSNLHSSEIPQEAAG